MAGPAQSAAGGGILFANLATGAPGVTRHAPILVSRMGQTLAVLFTVSVIIFALVRLIPGDPIVTMLGDEPVNRLVWDAFLPTLSLVVASLVVGLIVAAPSGIVAAMRKDSAGDGGSFGALLEDAVLLTTAPVRDWLAPAGHARE